MALVWWNWHGYLRGQLLTLVVSLAIVTLAVLMSYVSLRAGRRRRR